jgi:hypothetical protein
MPIVAVLALILPGAEGLHLTPVRHGSVEARLMVRVEPSRTPGHAELTLTLVVEGPPLLEVETPRLEDAGEDWEDDRTTWASLNDGRLTWTQVLRLQQTKQGHVPVPGLTVRFREGPGAPTQDARWPRILRDIREGGDLDRTGRGTPPASLPWWLYALPGGALLLLLPTALILRRSRRPPPAPETPDQRALAELDRAAADDSERFHTQIADVLRRYLAERFELKALQQTTAEFIESLRSVSQLSAEQQAVLRDALERCDQARFAGLGAPPEEWHALAEQVRAFIRETAAPTGRPADGSP